jgi:hypothetical protein
MARDFTSAQLKARNETFHLLSIAQRIASDAGLVAYADEIDSTLRGMKYDSELMAKRHIKISLSNDPR